MTKPQIRPKTPKLDMNPMVDLAFLLVTFFMLTTTFKTEDPISVETPSSQSEIKLPEKDIITIIISDDGRVFFSADGKHDKEQLIKAVNLRHNLQLSQDAIETFSLLNSFGIAINELPHFLNLDVGQRQDYLQKGIPCDSLKNELTEWLVLARSTNPQYRVAIKGDQNANYADVKYIINTLLENNVLRFNLITELEKEV